MVTNVSDEEIQQRLHESFYGKKDEDYRKTAPNFQHKRDLILYLDATIERLTHMRDYLEQSDDV
jgi:hypothetical protein